MIEKETVESLIEDSEKQIEQIDEHMKSYEDDIDQILAFKEKKKNYQFMIKRLKRFL